MYTKITYMATVDIVPATLLVKPVVPVTSYITEEIKK